MNVCEYLQTQRCLWIKPDLRWAINNNIQQNTYSNQRTKPVLSRGIDSLTTITKGSPIVNLKVIQTHSWRHKIDVNYAGFATSLRGQPCISDWSRRPRCLYQWFRPCPGSAALSQTGPSLPKRVGCPTVAAKCPTVAAKCPTVAAKRGKPGISVKLNLGNELVRPVFQLLARVEARIVQLVKAWIDRSRVRLSRSVGLFPWYRLLASSSLQIAIAWVQITAVTKTEVPISEYLGSRSLHGC